MKTYQTKPKTIRAIQFVPENFAEIEREWNCKIEFYTVMGVGAYRVNLYGDVSEIAIDDWIVKHWDAYCSVVDNDEFEKQYEEV